MKLEFKILWVDDQNTWVDDVKDDICQLIEEKGLIPDITVKNNIAQSVSYLESNCDIFDLILVDYNLGNNVNTNEAEYGDELINLIRKNKIFSNIIFYSSDEKSLRKIRNDSKLQGVYIFARSELQLGELDESIVPIIDYLIRRDLDLTSIRGISTSTVAFFDEQLKKLIVKYVPFEDVIGKINRKKDEKNKRIDENIDLIKSNCQDIKKSLKDNKIDSNLIDKILSTSILESSARYECLSHYLKSHDIDELKKIDLDKYIDDIIKNRNCLAHTFDENAFSAEEKRNVLKLLSKYKKIFDKVS